MSRFDKMTRVQTQIFVANFIERGLSRAAGLQFQRVEKNILDRFGAEHFHLIVQVGTDRPEVPGFESRVDEALAAVRASELDLSQVKELLKRKVPQPPAAARA